MKWRLVPEMKEARSAVEMMVSAVETERQWVSVSSGEVSYVRFSERGCTSKIDIDESSNSTQFRES